MKTNFYVPWLVVVMAGVLSACSPPPPTARLPVSVSLRADTTLAGRVFQDVNAYRRSHGLPEFQRHAGLDRLAQGHCEYLREHRGTFTISGKNVSHVGFEGRTLAARKLYRMENISENVAAANPAGGSPTAMLMNLWKNSKDHNKNLLDPWAYTGIGVVVDPDGTAFATELFATVSSTRVMTLERFNRF